VWRLLWEENKKYRKIEIYKDRKFSEVRAFFFYIYIFLYLYISILFCDIINKLSLFIMKIKDISQVKEWRGVLVLVRVDFNVALHKYKFRDDFKI
jgi:hypothetical protein